VATLTAELFGAGKFLENNPTSGSHPAGGTVSYTIAAPTVIPEVGTLYMTASDTEYAPKTADIKDW
jgi:hypothetical protein